MQRKAIKKITDNMQDCEEKRIPAEPIARYLKEKCKQDKEFCALVVQEHKTLEKCFDFVFEQAKNHLNNGGGWIEDNDVYMMAEDYFNLDDAEIERQKAEEEAKREEARRQREAEREQFRKAPHVKADTEQMTLFGEGD